MASNHSSSSSSLVSDSYDTPDTTAPSSPKPGVGNSNLLPSPFYPPSYSQREGVASKWETPSLPPYYPPLPSTSRSTEGALADKGSPDDGIIRDEALVRLTGKWPFNCEPSLPDLWSQVRLATGRCSAPGLILLTSRRASSRPLVYSMCATTASSPRSPKSMLRRGSSKCQGELRRGRAIAIRAAR